MVIAVWLLLAQLAWASSGAIPLGEHSHSAPTDAELQLVAWLEGLGAQVQQALCVHAKRQAVAFVASWHVLRVRPHVQSIQRGLNAFRCVCRPLWQTTMSHVLHGCGTCGTHTGSRWPTAGKAAFGQRRERGVALNGSAHDMALCRGRLL